MVQRVACGGGGKDAMGALRESETRPRGATRTGESIGAVREGLHKAHTGAAGPRDPKQHVTMHAERRMLIGFMYCSGFTMLASS